MSEFLVDTDWTADFLRGREPASRLIASFGREGFAISIITYAELYEGVANLSSHDIRRRELETFAQNTEVIGVDPEAGRVFGSLRSRLRAQGQMLADMDLFIAATALRHDMTLVSRDRHFDRITELKRHRSEEKDRP